LDRPVVSVVIPTLNEEAYIERTLRSLRDQDLDAPYEIVIGDGYSTDNTLAICSRYADKIVLERKRTPAAGRQSAVMQSSGRVLAFGCGDTLYPSNWLREITGPILRGEAAAVSGAVLPDDGTFFDMAGSKHVLLPLTWLSAKLGLYFTPGETIAFSRRAFDQVGGFDTDKVTAEDLDLFKRVSRVSKVQFNPNARVYVSMRRVRKWGRARYVAYHFSNFISYHLFHGSHQVYEPVR